MLEEYYCHANDLGFSFVENAFFRRKKKKPLKYMYMFFCTMIIKTALWENQIYRVRSIINVFVLKCCLYVFM